MDRLLVLADHLLLRPEVVLRRRDALISAGARDVPARLDDAWRHLDAAW